MQPTNSTISTNSLETFSGGASPIDYTTLWNQTLSFLSKPVEDVTVIDLDWEQFVKGAKFRQGITFGTGSISPIDRYDVYVRALCHVMVNAIPEQGLSSLAESISNLYEFYSAEMPQAVASQLPSTGTIRRARVVRRVEREPFELPEE